jgi:hypothetical protein
VEIMQGTLVLDYRDFKVTDGLEYWNVLCPQLIFRLLYRKRKRDRVCGRWWILFRLVIWFKKTKYYSETAITKEKLYYSRKDLHGRKA